MIVQQSVSLFNHSFFFEFFFFFFIYIHTSNLQKRKRLYKTQYPTIEHPNGGVLHIQKY